MTKLKQIETNSEVAQATLYREKVSGVIINSYSKILVGKYKGKGVNGKTKWTLPGGGVEHNEDYKESLIREIFEEVGIVKTKLGKIEKLGEYKVDYSQEYSQRFKEKSGILYKGKFETIFLVEYLGTDDEINLKLGNEFYCYRRVDISNLKNFISIELLKCLSGFDLINKIKSF